ncbi:M23 family metallopeptidase [Aliifodinibius sp. S!AR15-10]|uniref:M23 family metallopeptidase n=1 Tax=Aliifodinibius sp. S!AR15-10 TaxID=2950437 RepID=UPI002867692C|nr:M23 family metallopeptidase [Aliifodinibius sp. S!AR15-10]MDR8392148.1 M23 family metallopeptidase [Aliifodinibius sp. S!AR15-10]
MRSCFLFLWVLLTAPGLAGAQFTPDSADYIWPTNASPYLSGTFGETRSQHFHAALDIKTWGRRGYDVYATRNGLLHRIAIGPGGYGKAIYLKHSDGSYSVYAHLLSFEKEIQQLADSLRFRDYSNKIDIVLDSLDIQIKKGELIAYSGATGIGPPHLHFELRTPSEKPFNPLLTNLSIPDDIPPRFSSLAIEPLGPESRIEGHNKIHRKRPTRHSESYDFGTIEVDGPVGLAVDIYDKANRVHNSYAVYDLKLFHQEKLLFHSQVDSFSYNETGQMFLDRVYPLLEQNGKAYQRLYIADGNTLSFYKEGLNNGRLNLPEGRHEIRIVAEDFYGNRSEANLTLSVPMSSSQMTIFSSNGTNRSNGSHSYGGSTKKDWEWHKKWINFNGADSLDYTVISYDKSTVTARPKKVSSHSYINLHRADVTVIQRIRPNPGVETLHLYRMVPGRQGRVHSGNGSAYATFFENTLYDTLSVSLVSKILAPDSVQLNLTPDNQPLRGDFELTYLLNEERQSDSTLAFYEYDKRRKRLNYISSSRGGTILKGDAEKLGTYFILPDTTAPEIHSPRIYRRADGQWMGMVRAEDERSGIDYRTAEFYINGVRGIAEFEPEDDRILYYHPDFGPSSTYELRIVVADMLGNRIEKEFILD